MITTWFSRIYNFPQIGNVNEMKVVALKNFAKVAGKHLWWSYLSIKLQASFSIDKLRATAFETNFPELRVQWLKL